MEMCWLSVILTYGLFQHYFLIFFPTFFRLKVLCWNECLSLDEVNMKVNVIIISSKT